MKSNQNEYDWRFPWSRGPLSKLFTIYSYKFYVDPTRPKDISYKPGPAKRHYRNIAKLALATGTIVGSIYALKNWDSVSSRLHKLNPYSNS